MIPMKTSRTLGRGGRSADLVGVLSRAQRAPGDQHDDVESIGGFAGGSDHFSYSAFFKAWYRDRGTPYFFLFSKNLNVTNIQFAELISLLRMHTKGTWKPGRKGGLHFQSVDDFKESVRSLARAFPPTPDRPRLLAELYGDLLRRTVVIHTFFGSCAVFPPPGVSFELGPICRESGYIHSAGRAVHIRSVYKSRADDLRTRLVEYLKGSRIPKNKKIAFYVFSHEDFTPFDSAHRHLLRHGLDDVKVFLEKMYVGPERLVKALASLASDPSLKHRIAPAPPGSYKSHAEFQSRPEMLKDRCLWLLQDRGVSATDMSPTDTSYLICYEQLFKNRSPLHIFDENMPAWSDHTTIPHTLVAAMINVTRPGWPESVRFLDPFAGSGTIPLSACVRSNIQGKTPIVRACDIDPVGAVLTRTNLGFFSLSAAALAGLHRFLSDLATALGKMKSYEAVAADATWSEFKDAHALLIEAAKEEFKFSTSVASRLSLLSERSKLAFFVLLRAEKRHVAGIIRGNEASVDAFSREAEGLGRQIQELQDLRQREESSSRERDGISLIPGKYSIGVGWSPKDFSDGSSVECVTEELSATRGRGKQWEVIVTDPPYGFNTAAEVARLADLYGRMAREFIELLNPTGGQLVLALPEWSHTGRAIPMFALKGIVTEQILAAAHDCGREVSQPASSAPIPTALFRPPFYWESDRALRRSILHFSIRKIPET